MRHVLSSTNLGKPRKTRIQADPQKPYSGAFDSLWPALSSTNPGKPGYRPTHRNPILAESKSNKIHDPKNQTKSNKIIFLLILDSLQISSWRSSVDLGSIFNGFKKNKRPTSGATERRNDNATTTQTTERQNDETTKQKQRVGGRGVSL